MTSEQCSDLERRLRGFVVGQGDDLRAWIGSLSDVDDCVAQGLQRSIESADWALFEKYLLVAYQHPSSQYTAPLCEVLRRQSDDVNNEDIVDVLAAARDPAAVGCLVDTMRWEPPWDEFRQLAVKCIWALTDIGTADAVAALAAVARNETAELRSEATRALNKLGNAP